MSFVPLEMMMRRVEKYGDSDSAFFTELLYAGELILKITAAAFIAAIEDDRENHRYRLMHALVRADGVGEWASKLEETLTGPPSQHLPISLADDRRALTERLETGSWQYEAVHDLHEVLSGLVPNIQPLPVKVSLRAWFTMFAEVRNKTRGHGAVTPASCAKLVPKLHNSVRILQLRNPIFQRPWAYLHRNLSGKYNVVHLGGDTSAFQNFKSAAAAKGKNYSNGIYFFAEQPRRVELLYSDLNASDFFVPNGGFNGKNFEIHSLITDSRQTADAAPYLPTPGDRPASETEGKRELDIVGNVLTNLPSVPTGYVRRPRLEHEIRQALLNDRHPLITLVGRGGIGKTSLALAVLHEIAQTDRFSTIIWFSARDIDLTMAGPKVVRPRVLAETDIAEEYRSLVGPAASNKPAKASALSAMAEDMRASQHGATLFVFDNFETVRSPVDLFNWIDTNIRLPNKAVITSRFREFKADLPIEVLGMEEEEASALISQTAASLSIQNLLNTAAREQIIEESGGHPYVIKIILGEVAKLGAFGRPSKIIVRKDDILDALFERTYASLSPLANRIFLVLSGWRSLVPQLAAEAALLRHGADGADPAHAIDELVRMSLVERLSAEDGADFLSVPLTAAVFGAKKLEVSPHRQLVENDIRFLQDLGATTATGLKEGLRPRMAALFRKLARRISDEAASLEEMKPVLEFIARSYPPAWLLLAELNTEVEGEKGLETSAGYIRRFLEEKPAPDEAQAAWQRLMAIYRRTNNVVGACSALIRLSEIGAQPLDQISNVANWLNNERDIIERMAVAERGALFSPIARLMEQQLPSASATDLSRLAWLYLHVGDERRALEVAELGIERDPDNPHCRRLVDKLARFL